MKNLLFITLVFILGTSCTTMSKTDCQSGNWTLQGYKDALKGRAESHIEKQAKACRGFGYTVDEDEYTEGFESGLRKFCTFKQGYLFGREGGDYKDSCPKETEAEFYKGYVAGKKQRSLDDLDEENDD